jgi:hypothetical protein
LPLYHPHLLWQIDAAIRFCSGSSPGNFNRTAG